LRGNLVFLLRFRRRRRWQAQQPVHLAGRPLERILAAGAGEFPRSSGRPNGSGESPGVAPARMRSPQEAAADAHSLNHIQGQTLVVDGQAHTWSKDRSRVAESASRGAYHLVVSNQFHRFGALVGAGAAKVAENAYPGRRP
jgi:hypothetical protein